MFMDERRRNEDITIDSARLGHVRTEEREAPETTMAPGIIIIKVWARFRAAHVGTGFGVRLLLPKKYRRDNNNT